MLLSSGYVPFFFTPSSLCGQSEHRNTHACINTRTRTQPHAHNVPPPGTRVSHSPVSSYGRRFLVSPFSFLIISVCSSLPFFNILFLSLHMQSASPRSPLLPPSLPPFPSLLCSLSLHLLASLSLFSVCRMRGHYLSHSGHVRWNGGECSEQKQRAVGDRS